MCEDNYYERYTATCECLRTPLDKKKKVKGYRYLLKTEWIEMTKKEGWEKPLIIIGCNPSTANEMQIDRTMEKVSQFCQKKEYGGYIMLNLYPQINSDVKKLPDSVNEKIHGVNMKIIKNTIEENKNSDILFAFGGLIKEKDYLYDPCYKGIIEIINKKIEKDINYKEKLKRLSFDGNIFEYPLHFGYRRITNGVIDGGRLGLVKFNFQDFNENLDNKIQSKKAKNLNPKKLNKPLV